MRILLLTALLASAATPALARENNSDRSAAVERTAKRAEARRSERAQKPQRQVRSGQPSERATVARTQARPVANPRATVARTSVRPVANDRARERASVTSRLNRDAPASVRDWRRDQRTGSTRPTSVEQRNSLRETTERRRVTDAAVVRQPRLTDSRQRRISSIPVQGSQPTVSTSRLRESRNRWSDNSRRSWRDGWRRDQRYDWSDWRRRNSSLFRIGFYSDPFGWNYRRYNVGYRMWPAYYGSNFWLNDPWQYRLPYAPAGYRWIRYWDDAILVDTWTGEVVDVIHNFFW